MSEEPLQIVIVKTSAGHKIAVMGLNDKGHAETLRTYNTADTAKILAKEMPLLKTPPGYAD